jgi:tetratricopeptide (TPR) repeat protein
LRLNGEYERALSLQVKSLHIHSGLLGEDHPDTARIRSSLAGILADQGKHSEALELYQTSYKGLLNRLGEAHPFTCESRNSVATELSSLGKFPEAEEHLQRVLKIRERDLGERHPDTAISYNNLAISLSNQDQHAKAEPLLRKALEAFQATYGDDHPLTGSIHSTLGTNLHVQGRHQEATKHLHKALSIRQRALGDSNLETTNAAVNVALNLYALGKTQEAIKHLSEAAAGFELARVAGASGLDRAAFNLRSPRWLLATIEAPRDARSAWRELELSVGRGMLDHQPVVARASELPADHAELVKIQSQLDELRVSILPLLSETRRSENDEKVLNGLLEDRLKLERTQIGLSAKASQREVASLETVQSSIPADGAILVWADASENGTWSSAAPKVVNVQEHWVCVIRSRGEPRWERLPSTGEGGKWSRDDADLPVRFRRALAEDARPEVVRQLAGQLRTQCIAPALKHLDGVKTLYVVAVHEMAGVPVELIAPEYTVSYIPSGTFLARRGKRLDKPATILAVGDPTYPEVKPDKVSAALPPNGLLIMQVVPEGSAARARLQANDVLVSYAGQKIESLDQLGKLIGDKANEKEVTIQFWREADDKVVARDVPSGKLGVLLAKEPAREVIAAKRKTDALLARVSRGGEWSELPGTHVEVNALERLFGKDNVTSLTRSNASELALDTMRKNGDLTKFRYLHFAMHGEANNVRAFDSKLILAQDTPRETLSKPGEPLLNNELSAGEVLEHWKLDADLVTLSACETAIGKSGGGDGMLGFAQAFLLAGSRAVCLSLWKVDDCATALLMDRFYRNILGKRDDNARPMAKAAALSEAKSWLKDLTMEEAETRLGKVTQGVVRGPKHGREILPEIQVPMGSDKSNRPFAHPRYWAAFVLIGDPD